MNRPDDAPTGLVRPAVPDDIAAIASVLRDAFAEYEPLYTPAAFAATTLTEDRIRNRWSEGPVWVAVHAGAVVGTVAAVPQHQALYIRSMGLLPDARGLGLGAMLLEEVQRFAVRHGCTRMYLSTTPFLHRAIQLYRRFGFERTDEGPVDLHGTPLLTMEKVITAGIAS